MPLWPHLDHLYSARNITIRILGINDSAQYQSNLLQEALIKVFVEHLL